MAKLNLSVAVGDYDRTRALIDGAVQIDGVDPVYMQLVPEEIFFRAFRAAEFDICELSMSSYTVKTAQGNCPYIAVPAFVSRAFRHTSVYVRTDRVKKPQDLKGRKVGVPEYQLTANVWARAFLEDDFGVKRSDIHWIRGGIEHAGRPEKITVKLPPECGSTTRPRARPFRRCSRKARSTASSRRGRRRSSKAATRISAGCSPIRSRWPKDYYKRTGFFPIMHVVGVQPRIGRAPSLAARRGVESLRAIETSRIGEIVRHLGDQSDASIRRGAPRRSARADGPRFLVIRRRAEP